MDNYLDFPLSEGIMTSPSTGGKQAPTTKQTAMTKKAKIDAYQRVTDRVLELIEQGVAPWRKTWQGTATEGPVSMSTGKEYQGINWILLSWAGYGSRYWGTYKSITENGGQVRKGEKATPIIFWSFIEKKDEKTGEVTTVGFLRNFSVFNLEQADWADGVPEKFQPAEAAVTAPTVQPIEAAEAIAQGYLEGVNPPTFEPTKGDRAYYSPSADRVVVPEIDLFEGPGEYYSTLFHELGHSTGHADRLKRPGVVKFDKFGSHQYSKEELVAEFTACFLCADAGIEDTRENSAAYLANWSKVIKEDKRLLVQAATQAQKAATMIREGGAKPAKKEVKQAA